jgi:ABC-type Mn2+/Zn2+ transport system permease subunit
MLITPAATARLLTDRLPMMLGLSAGLGATSGVLGLLLSFHANVAAGGTIVLVATGMFGAVWLLSPLHGVIANRLARRRLIAAPTPIGLEPLRPRVPDGR